MIGAAVLLLTLRYGVPMVFSARPASGAGLGGALLWLAGRAAAWCPFAVSLIAFQAALASWTDLATLIGIATQIRAPANDAQAMADRTGIPALL